MWPEGAEDGSPPVEGSTTSSSTPEVGAVHFPSMSNAGFAFSESLLRPSPYASWEATVCCHVGIPSFRLRYGCHYIDLM